MGEFLMNNWLVLLLTAVMIPVILLLTGQRLTVIPHCHFIHDRGQICCIFPHLMLTVIFSGFFGVKNFARFFVDHGNRRGSCNTADGFRRRQIAVIIIRRKTCGIHHIIIIADLIIIHLSGRSRDFFCFRSRCRRR